MFTVDMRRISSRHQKHRRAQAPPSVLEQIQTPGNTLLMVVSNVFSCLNNNNKLVLEGFSLSLYCGLKKKTLTKSVAVCCCSSSVTKFCAVLRCFSAQHGCDYFNNCRFLVSSNKFSLSPLISVISKVFPFVNTTDKH